MILLELGSSECGDNQSVSPSVLHQYMPPTKPSFILVEKNKIESNGEKEEKDDRNIIVIPDTLNPVLNKQIDSVMKVYRLRYDTEYFMQYISEIKYRKNDLEYREDVFKWQFSTSKWIFYLVMLIVLSGLIFSSWHFIKTLKGATSEIDLTASMTELKIKTSLIGLVILIVSIVFLFLYLKFVYPINVVEDNTQVKTEQIH
ncbi:MAG: hypothetical protein K8I03_05705 [Ignavibacteria bacterium]|nr:hypothetical protein [Ignavibacteria bacterium]